MAKKKAAAKGRDGLTLAAVDRILDKRPHEHSTVADLSAAPGLPDWLAESWPYVEAMLVAYGKPLAIDGLRMLREKVDSMAIKPWLVKRMILRAIDSALADLTVRAALQVADPEPCAPEAAPTPA